ncbi:MAG: CHASE2 domain-containing protein [Symploca sp. SIO3E6]|nr:CHASE2 domain-containing protein [Caldora sp. SIO3E6]
MGKLVTLKIINGDLKQGLPVILRIGEDGSGTATEFDGWLPPAPQLPQLCSNWYSSYRSGGEADSQRALSAPAAQITNFSILDSANDLANGINNWLNSDDTQFRPFRDKLLRHLPSNEPIRFIIQTDNVELWRLPWHLWDVFQKFKVEVNLSPSEYEIDFPPAEKPRNQVRILVILGNDSGIDIERDLASLQQELPYAYIHPLRNLQKNDLSSELWEQEWDILFFAGHSSTQENLQGRFSINPQESFTIEELKFALTEAIEHGLKLAIFNSCDGLGLARELASLQIPATMVMRERVPDEVAQKFLLYFLKAFAKKGKSLSAAVWEARARLQELEEKYPCASWLPIVCQNPAQVPPTWEELQQKTQDKYQSLPKPKLFKVFLVSLIITGLVLGVRSLGFLQSWELKAFDQMMGLRADEGPDPRLLVITITDKDLQLPEQQNIKGSLADLALYQLLRKLESYQPRVIGLDIFRDPPSYAPKLPELKTSLQQNNHFYGICHVPENNTKGILPPPDIPRERLGFSNILPDSDRIVRRHLLSMTVAATSGCPASNALSLQLALHYLKAEGITPSYTPEGNLQLGKVVFKRLQTPVGVYQNADTWGNQVLLNYRSYRSPLKIAETVTLSQFINNEVRAETIKDRVVLIGAFHSMSDYFLTPYSSNQLPPQEIPGVILHAQMISQILRAVLDERPLIVFLPLWGEILWIGSWSLIGGILALSWQTKRYQIMMGVISLGILWGLSYYLLAQGYWIPLIPSSVVMVITGVVVIAYFNKSSPMNL